MRFLPPAPGLMQTVARVALRYQRRQGCSWSAASNASWITITSGASGAGNGSVNYSVAGYDVLNGDRQGTITVAGRTVTIEQHGPILTSLPEHVVNHLVSRDLAISTHDA